MQLTMTEAFEGMFKDQGYEIIDCTPATTDKELVRQYLKTGWHSYFDINNHVKSTEGGRRLRELRSEGIIIQEREKTATIGGKNKHWKEFRI